MSVGNQEAPSVAQLLEENEALRQRLEEAEQTIEAIRQGEVDAVVVVGPRGEQVYSLTGAEHVYRVIIETMHEAALTADPDGTILFCNQRFCDLMRAPMREVLGRKVATFADSAQQAMLEKVLTDAQEGPIQRHLSLHAADGTDVPVLLSANPLETGDGSSICVVASDLTELEESAHSIRVLREQRQALAESEERLRQAAQAAHFGVYYADLVNDHLYWSPEMREIVGLTEEMPTPQTPGTIPDFIHPDDVESVRRLMRSAYDLAGDGLVQSEHRIVRPDGTVRWVLLKGQIRFEGQHANRRPVRSNGIMLDITERKEAEQALWRSEAKYRTLFESIDEGFCVVEVIFDEKDRPIDYRFLEINPAFAKHAGLDNALGQRMRELAPDHEDFWFEVYGRVARTQKPARFQSPAAALGRFYDVYAFPIGEPDQSRVAVLFNDITEHKHAEEALRQSNAVLEARVAERTVELEQRARQLQMLAMELSATEARERRRLAEILHDDLQQQLAGTKFHVTLLGRRLKEDGEAWEMVKQIDGMIKGAIHSSRNLSHELSPAVLYRSDLCETFEWMAEEMQSKHGLVIHVVGREVSLESDALKAFVYKAGQELLFNVVKHARVNEAWVRLRRLGPCIGLMVCDRGRGFEPTALSSAVGFGLLSIRERVELLGGRMKIQSTPGVGSRFLITVPDRELAEAATELETRKQAGHIRPEEDDSTEMVEEASGPVIRVVIADDHEIVRQGLAALFEEEPDIELVGEAGNGREAIDVAHRTRPDVVIMDVSMPLISGEEATRQIKAYVPGTRVIALSMFGDPVMAEKMRRVGAETYLCKTDASETLLAAIRGNSTPQD